MELKKGDRAIEFSLPDAEGKLHGLKEYRGKTLVLYFYPKDDTPGCTVEACGFRDANSQIMKKGANVVGVSGDNAISHQKFISKYKLNFTLLTDNGNELAKKYGAWGKKEFMGKKYDGIIRSTFIISPDGKIKKAMYGVNPKDHDKEVLDAI